MDGLKALVEAVDNHINRSTLHAEVKNNILMWHETHQKSREYADKVKRGEELSEEESKIYQSIVYAAMDYQAEQVDRLLKSGVIKDDREFGRECQKVSNMLYDKMLRDDTD